MSALPSAPRPRRRGGTVLALVAALLTLAACSPRTALPYLPSVGAAAAAAAAGAAPSQAVFAVQEGEASWYGPGFAGRTTSNGEIFDPAEMTAAHRTLPFGTRVRVTNLETGSSVEVRINDRGPFKAGRIIDLSRAAADRIGMLASGVARVRVEVVSGTPGATRLATMRDLVGFEVRSALHAPGQLLVLRSDRSSGPVLVRVVEGEVPLELQADLLVADELLAALGPVVDVSID
jgi:rare lipoprotein A